METSSRGRRASSQRIARSILRTTFAVAVTIGAATAASAATYVVDDDGTYDALSNTCDGFDVAFTVIQTAINSATDGDTIFVCPGTYNESQVRIDRGVAVQGSGVGNSIIDGGGGNGLASGQFGLIRMISQTGDASFDGFTVRNAKAAGTLRVAIAASSPAAVTFTVTNNLFLGSNNPADGSDYGLYTFGPLQGQPSNHELIFQHNEIHENGSNPILVERHRGPLDISYNTFDRGVRSAGITALFDMSHSGDAITSLHRISYNTIDMGNDPGPYTSSNGSTAIAVVGAFTGGSLGSFSNVEITHNTILNLRSYRRGIQLWNNSNDPSSALGDVNALVSCNELSGPATPEEGSVGIRTIGRITGSTVTNNSISGVDTGLLALLFRNGVATGMTLNENSFENTGLFAVDWQSTEVIDAENNWWGSDTGPTTASNPSGTGGIIGASAGPGGSGEIDYSPWLASGTDGDAGPCFVPEPSGECVEVGTCNEIDGCTETPVADGTSCGGGLYTCSAGSCGGELLPMVLSRATLRTSTNVRRPNGRVTATAIINDNDTDGGFAAALLADEVSVDVVDSAGFSATRTLTNCVAKRKLIRCSSADRLTRALFLFKPRGPYLYTMKLTMRGFDASETGTEPPTAPATFTINQGPATRTDTIGDFSACRSIGRWTRLCREG